MSISAYTNSITSHFNTQWNSRTPVCNDNAPFVTPDPEDLSSNPNSWVKVEVWDGKGNKASLGAGAQLRRYTGTVFIEVYSAKSHGTGYVKDYVDQIISIFRDVQANGVTYYEPSVSRVGEKYYANTGSSTNATSQWWSATVAIPFRYDEIA